MIDDSSPFFSVCIPQYNRTSFLLVALRTLAAQTFRNFEVCISDDCSTDGRSEELQRELRALGLKHTYYRQPKNLRYDGNLRAAIGLAAGRYCLLMGNDDRVLAPDTLEKLHAALREEPETGVVITNYLDDGDGPVTRRVRSGGSAAGSAELAVARFRNFAFVSGVLLRRDLAQAHATNRWDGAEMYQMYLGCRILAEGYRLLEMEDVMIVRGIIVAHESVDSYASKPPLHPCPIEERRRPLSRMGALVFDAVRPYVTGSTSWAATRILLHILVFTFPYWIVEYRRIQSWNYAVGICLGMRPRVVVEDMPVQPLDRLLLRVAWAVVGVAGLLMPVRLFDKLRPRFYGFAKTVLQWS